MAAQALAVKSVASTMLFQCQTLPEQYGRSVVRCDHCGLVQFLPEHRHCRRCSIDFTAAAAPAAELSVPCSAARGSNDADYRARIARTTRFCRLALGLSQHDVARRMGVVRVHISKIEHGVISPFPDTLQRLVSAMGIPMWLFCDLLEIRGL